MTLERLTDLRSSNQPGAGSAIGPGDVVRFNRPDSSSDARRTVPTEGIVQVTPPNTTDQFGRPVFKVQDADGEMRFPLQSSCVRVDPAPQPEDTSSIRPFDERKEH